MRRIVKEESAVPPPATSASEDSPLYPGWRVVLAAHFGAMVSFGSLLVFTFGVFLKPLTAEFGWSREEVSRAFAIAAMTVAAVSPFLGRALDRWGPRPIVIPCFALFGTAVLSLSRLSGPLWELYAAFFVIGLAGNGTTQMGYGGAVAGWFTARRGLALACVMAGVGIGSIVHPILAERCIAAFGWRTAYLILGAMVLLSGIPLTAAWVRRSGESGNNPLAESGSTIRGALGHRAFWVLVAVLFVSSIAANGTLTHMAAHLSDRGMTASQAALATGVLGGANLAGRLLTGWLLDRFFGPRLSFWLLAVMAAGFAALALARSLPVAMIAAVLIGLGLGGEADVTPYLLSRYFGLASFSTLYGITWTFYALAGAVGPVLFGRVFDTSGSYDAVLRLSQALAIIAAILMLAMPRYPRASV